MPIRKSKDAPPGVYAAAHAAVTDFWGIRSNGSDERLAQAEQVLKEHDLSAAQLDRLRMGLPAIADGTTTGGKVRRMDSLLLRLHTAAA